MSIQYMAPGFEPMTLEQESLPITTRPGFRNCFFLKKWVNPGLFYRLFSAFPNKHLYKFYNKLLSIQYAVPGFESMTFGT